MRYFGKSVSAAILTGVLSVFAASSASAAPSKLVYVGPKVQAVIINDSAFSGQAFNIGVVGGYRLMGPGGKLRGNLGGGTLSVEGETSITIVPGTFEYDYVCGFATTCTAEGDWEMNTFGAYAAYHYPKGNITWKGKAGLQRNQVKTEVTYTFGGVTTTVSGSDTDIDPALGGGLMMPIGPGKFEAELMLLPRSDTTISIGANYLFEF